MPTVYWLCGPTGCGKTRQAFNFCPQSTWMASNCMQWFDGYNNESVAIFDDFRSSDCKFNWFLQVTDRYLKSVPVKGGFVPWNPSTIVITCPRRPEDEFINHTTGATYEDIKQVLRRVHVWQWNTNLDIWDKDNRFE